MMKSSTSNLVSLLHGLIANVMEITERVSIILLPYVMW